MSNLTPSLTWRGRIASLCLALLLAVGIAARAVALPTNPQDSVRSFYDYVADHNEGRRDARRKRTVCAAGARD